MLEINCPILRLRNYLSSTGVDEGEMEAIRQAAEDEMVAALDAARNAPWPANNSVFADVQDIGSPAKEAF